MSPVRNRISEGMTRERFVLELKRATRPFAIWVAILAAGFSATAFIVSELHLSLPWQDRYTVRFALDDDAKGIVPRSQDVRIAGVPMGRLTKVELDHGRQVVTAEFDPGNGVLYRDAHVRLRPATPLNDQFLDVVDRGTPAAGAVADHGLLDAGRTQTYVDLGKVLNVFNADVRPRVSAAIQVMGNGLADHGAQLRRALAELAPFLQAARRLTRENAVRAHQTRRLIHNFALVNAELARRDRQVTRLVRGGDAAFTTLAGVNDSLAAFIDELPPTLRAMPRSFATLRAAAAELDPAAQALLPVARALPGGLGALERLSPDLRAGLAALDPALPRLTDLLRSSRPLGGGLADAFAHLRPQAPAYDRVTRTAVPCELALQKFFMNTISLAKFSDVHGVNPRGQEMYGTATAGVPDPGLRADPSCAGGEPRKEVLR